MSTALLFILLMLGCARSGIPSDEVTTEANAKHAINKKRKIVTWSYLRAMAARGNNPSIVDFLKKYNKLVPTKPASGARVTGDCEDPWEDDCDPIYPDTGGILSYRIDLPFKMNGQDLVLSIVVMYDSDTGQPVSQGCTIYGAGSPNTVTNYADPVASYSNGQLTFIGNISYSYTTSTERTLGANASGNGTLGPVGLNVGFNGDVNAITTLTNTGIIYMNVSTNLDSSYGTGYVQLNGINGPSYDYTIVPQQ